MKNLRKVNNSVVCAGRVLGAPRKTEKGFFLTLGDGKEKADFLFVNNDRVNWHDRLAKITINDGDYLAVVGSEKKDGDGYFGNQILFAGNSAEIYSKEKKAVSSTVLFGYVGNPETKDGRFQVSIATGPKENKKWVKATFANNEHIKLAEQAEKFLGKGDLVLIVGSPINEQYNSTWANSFNLIKKKTAPKAE